MSARAKAIEAAAREAVEALDLIPEDPRRFARMAGMTIPLVRSHLASALALPVEPSPTSPDREALGRLAHETWRDLLVVRYGKVKAELLSWGELTDEDREIDRSVAERLYAAGVAAERTRVVAYLRDLSREAETLGNPARWPIRDAAEVIEDGDHPRLP